MQQDDARSAAVAPRIIAMRGRVDFATVEPIAEAISRELRAGHIDVVLDMQALESLSGGAMGSLLLQQTEAERLGGSIKMAGVRRRVYRALKTNGFTAVFDIHDNTEAALRAFKAKRSRVA
ncbi:MAG: STAS domain-containing protein [Candidatus Eiseniibacteriota bacterium]|jgi:anti-anti-sigma factor